MMKLRDQQQQTDMPTSSCEEAKEESALPEPRETCPLKEGPPDGTCCHGISGYKTGGTQKKYLNFSLLMPFIKTQIETSQSGSPMEAVLGAQLPSAQSMAENRYGSWLQIESKQCISCGA